MQDTHPPRRKRTSSNIARALAALSFHQAASEMYHTLAHASPELQGIEASFQAMERTGFFSGLAKQDVDRIWTTRSRHTPTPKNFTYTGLAQRILLATIRLQACKWPDKMPDYKDSVEESNRKRCLRSLAYSLETFGRLLEWGQYERNCMPMLHRKVADTMVLLDSIRGLWDLQHDVRLSDTRSGQPEAPTSHDQQMSEAPSKFLRPSERSSEQRADSQARNSPDRPQAPYYTYFPVSSSEEQRAESWWKYLQHEWGKVPAFLPPVTEKVKIK